MLFHSGEFLFVFLPMVLIGARLLAGRGDRRAAIGFLALASVFFYGWWNWAYLSLLLPSIAFNFACGRLLVRQRRRDIPRTPSMRGTLAVGVGVNLVLLGYFKYANFFLDTVDALVGAGWNLPRIVLPLGISFFTFQQIAYLVDVYRGEGEAPDFPSYCLFVAFFPQLVAGPIVRPRELLPQFEEPDTFVAPPDTLGAGLFAVAIGLFKKVVLADTLGLWAGPIFDQAPSVSFSDAWGASLAFALQVYFDFSGYSDIAVGLGLMLNVSLPENFNSPYQATSIIDFWRRWHMTLSSFLRDYVYLPLGGSRKGRASQNLNLFVTMVLCGLWHGASWPMVLFGAAHGALLMVNHWWRRVGIELPKGLCWLMTFLALLVTFPCFRAPSFARLGMIVKGMIGLGGFAWDPFVFSMGRHEFKRLVVLAAVVLFCPNRQAMMAWRWEDDYAYALSFGVIGGVSILSLGRPKPFVYFVF